MTEFGSAPLLPPWLLLLSIGGAAALLSAISGFRLSLRLFLRLSFLLLLGVLGLGPSVFRPAPAAPEIVFLLDGSRSMAVGGRFDRARELLNLLRSSRKGFVSRILSFGETITPLDDLSLSRLSPSAETTRIGWALEKTLDSFENLQAVVLLSDGIDLGRTDPTEAAREAGRRHVPVYAIPLGQRIEAPDGVLASSAPRRLSGEAGREIEIPIEVAVSGPSPSKATVEAWENGRRIAAHDVRLRGGRGKTVFRLRLPPRPFTVWEFRLPPLPGERRLEGNRVEVVAESGAVREKVLILEGRPRWEATLALRTLAADPTFRVRAARLMRKGRPVLYDLPESAFPVTPERMEEATLLILGEGWEKTCRSDAIALAAGKKILLLAGADPAPLGIRGFRWTTPVRGTIHTEKPVIAPLVEFDGIEAEGLGVLGSTRRVFAVLGREDRSTTPAVFALPSKPVVVFALSNLRWFDRDPREFWIPFLEKTFGLGGKRTLRTAALNYDLGDLVRIEGRPGATITIVFPGSAKRTEVLTLDGEGAATFKPEGSGLYRLEGPEGARCVFAVHDRREETLVIEPDHALLRRMATLSGGLTIPPDRDSVLRLARKLSSEAEKRRRFESVYVWDHPGVFLLMAALIFLTFFLRKPWTRSNS